MGGKKVTDLRGLLAVEENVIYLNVKDVMKYSVYIPGAAVHSECALQSAGSALRQCRDLEADI